MKVPCARWLLTTLLAGMYSVAPMAADSRVVTAGGHTSPDAYPGMNLAWREEFGGRALDATRWGVAPGAVADGYLVLVASNEAALVITTEGREAFSLGRIDIRARLPAFENLQSSVWLSLAAEGGSAQPALSRLEILAATGSAEVQGTVHWREQGGERYESAAISLPAGSFSDQFHVFSLVWTAGTLRWLVDGYPYLAFDAAPGDPPSRFHLGIKLGTVPQQPTDDSSAAALAIDYIRVFQNR